MAHIKIKEGLDIPIGGKPQGIPQPLLTIRESSESPSLHLIALDLTPFDDVKFKLLIRLEDHVKQGQPLAEDKESPGRFFVSPAGGVIREIRRGLKRKLLYIVIEVASNEEIEQFPKTSLSATNREDLIEKLKIGGFFAHVRQRPFNFLVHPEKKPRSIFVKAIESAPLTPPSEMQVEGYEKEFQYGLDALSKLSEGKVHLIYRHGTSYPPFVDAKGVEKHSAEGPHPVANASLHIEQIDPIHSATDIIWVLDARTVVALGYFLLHGQVFVSRVISIAGPGILEGKTGYFKVREGCSIASLSTGRIKKEAVRLISGNPLTGHEVNNEDFLGYEETVFCAIPENTKREFLHFFRLGWNKFTASGAYLGGHLDYTGKEYPFTTNQHGEKRAFVDSTLYDDVMPLNVPTMPLVKALLADDYELAEQLGLLEVDSEDFALPAFVCPSKIEMPEIVKVGLRRHAADMLK